MARTFAAWGLGAAWLPDQDTLITADRRRLISVRVSWTGRVVRGKRWRGHWRASSSQAEPPGEPR